MKIMWITNIIFPEALDSISGNNDLKSSGGWMIGAAEALLRLKLITLTVVSVSEKVEELTKIIGKDIVYYLIPKGKGNHRINSEYDSFCKALEHEVRPDVVHIHGTEYSHGLSYIRACSNKNIVISIQGLTSVYSNYYNSGISLKDIISNLTIQDLIRGTGILTGKKDFEIRGKFEKEMIRSVHHVIGRTSWDRAHTWVINPDAKYHFCNETLRNEFYKGQVWVYDKCIKHRIFLSQATYPIKGLHQLIKAMPIVLKHYPDAHIRIAGNNISNGFSNSFIFQSGYSKFINSLIKQYNLFDKISFIGKLNANQMIEEYLHSNVFICPSTIENSPNSLGEAQILGVPCITSYVGGVCDMMQMNEDKMYRFEEIEMLAYKICDLFSKEGEFPDTKSFAEDRHNPENNAKQLFSIYSSIMNS